MADKFDIYGLKAVAAANFCVIFPPFHDFYGTGHGLRWFSITSPLISSILKLIPYIYENTSSVDDLLREVMAKNIVEDLEDWYEQERFRLLLIQTPQFSADIMREVLKLDTKWRNDLRWRKWRKDAIAVIPGIGEPSDLPSDEQPTPMERWAGKEEELELKMAQCGLKYHHLKK